MLFSVSDLKSYLGITSDAEDVWLELLARGVDAGVKRYLRRNIEQKNAVIEFRSGDGLESLYTQEYPVRVLTSVWLDPGGYFGKGAGSPFADATLLTEGVDFVCEETGEQESAVGRLIHLRCGWPRGIGNVKLLYDHGYTQIPGDIKLGCYLACAAVRSGRKYGTQMASETLGDYSYQLLSGGDGEEGGRALTDALGYLRPWRRVVV